jgi:hypothetical protein
MMEGPYRVIHGGVVAGHPFYRQTPRACRRRTRVMLYSPEPPDEPRSSPFRATFTNRPAVPIQFVASGAGRTSCPLWDQ